MYQVTFNIDEATAKELVKLPTLKGLLDDAILCAQRVHDDHSVVRTDEEDEEDSIPWHAKRTKERIEEIGPALVALHMITRLKLLVEIKKGQ